MWIRALVLICGVVCSGFVLIRKELSLPGERAHTAAGQSEAPWAAGAYPHPSDAASIIDRYLALQHWENLGRAYWEPRLPCGHEGQLEIDELGMEIADMCALVVEVLDPDAALPHLFRRYAEEDPITRLVMGRMIQHCLFRRAYHTGRWPGDRVHWRAPLPDDCDTLIHEWDVRYREALDAERREDVSRRDNRW